MIPFDNKHVWKFLLAIVLGFIIMVVIVIYFNNNERTSNQIEISPSTVKTSIVEKTYDKEGVIKLIKNVLKWANSENAIDLLPTTAAEEDTIYNGFDLVKLNKNLKYLESTNLFSIEFIENYNQLILTLDKKLKANEFYGPWYIGDAQPFYFAHHLDPWTHSQEIPHDPSVVWDLVEVKHLQDETYQWVWGGLTSEHHPDWKDFSYKFKVTMENSILKISYLEGFDNVQVIKE
ncbi:hypothetical protein [Carboxylicivirga sp. N1Y90]|uniref:hypothetical protein n=1 Tax=Carboxylicivirga fragile TaxID=3417571 RepID=UPI003D3292D3|nr:hypothetical protein [Marinilabiliaceae bacterium N1Y90]